MMSTVMKGRLIGLVGDRIGNIHDVAVRHRQPGGFCCGDDWCARRAVACCLPISLLLRSKRSSDPN